MKILTCNLWSDRGPAERQPVLRKQLQALDADLLCLQEATNPALLTNLSYPVCIHAPKLALAILSRFPLRSHQEVIYKTESPLESYRRGLQLAELVVESASFWVVTTHLSWKPEDNVSRMGQVEELIDLTRSLSGPILLSGDFNAPPTDPPIQRIREAGFADLFAALHPSDPGITWDNQNPFIQSHSVQFPDRRIDYLFFKNDSRTAWTPTGCEVVLNLPSPEGIYPSDHCGVLATFKT